MAVHTGLISPNDVQIGAAYTEDYTATVGAINRTGTKYLVPAAAAADSHALKSETWSPSLATAMEMAQRLCSLLRRGLARKGGGGEQCLQNPRRRACALPGEYLLNTRHSSSELIVVWEGKKESSERAGRARFYTCRSALGLVANRR
jgi:hypothetical protein